MPNPMQDKSNRKVVNGKKKKIYNYLVEKRYTIYQIKYRTRQRVKDKRKITRHEVARRLSELL